MAGRIVKGYRTRMIVLVKVKPGARRDAIVSWDAESRSLELALRAPPVDGKANAALVRFLGEVLDLAPSRVTLKTGAGSRIKRVELPDDTDVAPLAGMDRTGEGARSASPVRDPPR